MSPPDPLSQWLELIAVRATFAGSLWSRGEWSVAFSTESTKINVVTEGRGWLLHAALPEPVPLAAGDGFMLTRADRYVLCSDPSIEPQDADKVFDSPHGRCDGGSGAVFRAIGCRIDLDSSDIDLLYDALPPVLPIHASAMQAPALRWLIERLGTETTHPSAGSAASSELMAQLLFVEVIRHWAQIVPLAAGPLAALRDARIASALRLLHAEPARAWRLEALARAVGMSRTGFALRFRQLLGQTPLDYLTRWRMRLAARSLREGRMPLAHIASAVGYQSDSAFSQAFKRAHGLPPNEYRRRWQAADMRELTAPAD